MDSTERMKIRIEHWINHNENHLEEYQAVARELEACGKVESAHHIRQMAALLEESNDHLSKALQSLKQACR